MNRQLIQKYWAEIATILVFFVYQFTLAPSVIEIDSGELAAVQITFGIAHPTGYPLFTLIGYLFSLLPLPVTKIFQMNLLASIYCTAAFYFICKTFFLSINIFEEIKNNFTNNKRLNKAQKNKAEITLKLDGVKKIIVSLLAGFSLAFSTTFWLQSTSVEVYSLHLLVVSSIVFLFTKLFVGEQIKSNKYWLILSILFALGFSNHMSTLMLVPSALIILIISFRRSSITYYTLLKCAGLFAAFLTLLYSILYIRAGFDPILNWGNPETIENLIRHVSGKQYQVWLFSSFEVAKGNLVNFFGSLPNEFGLPIVLIALIGIYYNFVVNKYIFIFWITSFLFTILYASNYDIKDLQTYYLLAIISAAFFVFSGMLKLLELSTKYKIDQKITLFLLFILVSTQVIFNLSKVNQDDVFIFEDYTKALIGSTDQNSIVFSYQWDYFLSASYYFQFVEDYRNDVVIIDKELLRRSWYYKQLSGINQKLFNGFDNDVTEFLIALEPFERGSNFDSQKLETYFQKIMTNLIKFNVEDKSYYIGPELVENEMRTGQFKLPEGYSIVPDLFLFKITKGNTYVPASEPNFKLRMPDKPNNYHNFIENLVAKMLIYRTLYEIEFDKLDRARIYARKVQADFPTITLPENIKKILSL